MNTPHPLPDSNDLTCPARSARRRCRPLRAPRQLVISLALGYIVLLVIPRPVAAEMASGALPQRAPAPLAASGVVGHPSTTPREGQPAMGSTISAAASGAPSEEHADAKAPEATNGAPQTPHTNSSGGFLDFNVYPYMTNADDDSVFTLNAFAKLPYGFSYFSLLNTFNQANKKPLYDTTGFYTEQNLRYTPSAVVPLDLTIQYNMRSGEDNDRLRFGARWRLSDTPLMERVFKALYVAYSINFHLLQLDHEETYVWQMEHVGKLSTPYLDNRLYVAGFADHTFNSEVPDGVRKSPLIMEIQGGLRLVEELYAVAEYRLNDFRLGNKTNLAFGGQYMAKW